MKIWAEKSISEQNLGRLDRLVVGQKAMAADGKEITVYADEFSPITEEDKRKADETIKPTGKVVDIKILRTGNDEVKTEYIETAITGVSKYVNSIKKKGATNFEPKREGYVRRS